MNGRWPAGTMRWGPAVFMGMGAVDRASRHRYRPLQIAPTPLDRAQRGERLGCPWPDQAGVLVGPPGEAAAPRDPSTCCAAISNRACGRLRRVNVSLLFFVMLGN